MVKKIERFIADVREFCHEYDALPYGASLLPLKPLLKSLGVDASDLADIKQLVKPHPPLVALVMFLTRKRSVPIDAVQTVKAVKAKASKRLSKRLSSGGFGYAPALLNAAPAFTAHNIYNTAIDSSLTNLPAPFSTGMANASASLGINQAAHDAMLPQRGTAGGRGRSRSKA